MPLTAEAIRTLQTKTTTAKTLTDLILLVYLVFNDIEGVEIVNDTSWPPADLRHLRPVEDTKGKGIS